MTRLHSATPFARTLRALIGIGAAFVLAVAASGCANSAPPAPTPDPFAGLADKSDQAFRQGLESYGAGQYRDALTSFEQARLLSPTADSRIDQMIERAQVALAPQATPVPPTPTVEPATPSATSVPMSALTPDTDLGSRYFGKVTLGLVPGTDTDAPAASVFFFQDQIGLHIEGLKQHLRLPFMVRVFDLDADRMIAEVQSEDVSAGKPTLAATPNGLALGSAAAPTATPASTDVHLVRFWDTFVWYHQGGDPAGRYRLELSANGVLTNTFDYTVGNVPVLTPTPVVVAEPTLDLTPTAPSATELPAPTTVPAASAPPTGPVAPVAAEPVVAPTEIPIPTPTIVPTPQTAYTTIVGGVPAGLGVDSNTGRFYLVDASGFIWSSDAPTGQELPTLGTPVNIGDRSPVDLAVDPNTGYLYLSTRVCAPVAPGCIVVVDGRARQSFDTGGPVIRNFSLPSAPADLRLDTDLGLLYVALPGIQSLAEIDIRGGTVLNIITGLPQITSLALDPLRHTLYATSLNGQLTVVDAASGKVTGRIPLTAAGLASVATARGLAYAVNTVTHELAVVEPISQTVLRYPLSQEPAAIAAAEDSGTLYVLSSRADVILRIDPTDGSELGRVVIGNRTGRASTRPNDLQGLRPRLILDPADDTLYATLPEAGSLAAMNEGSFPIMARAIPQPFIPDAAMAADFPEALWPAAVTDDLTSARGQ